MGLYDPKKYTYVFSLHINDKRKSMKIMIEDFRVLDDGKDFSGYLFTFDQNEFCCKY